MPENAVDADEEIRRLLENSKTIAVVGLSRDRLKDSHMVAAYLKKHGYRIVPVNPAAEENLGERCYPSLLDLPEELRGSVDIVDIFRPSADIPPIVEQAIRLRERHGRPQAVWMQLGIVNEEAARRARRAGLMVVMDKCMMTEHQRLRAIRS